MMSSWLVEGEQATSTDMLGADIANIGALVIWLGEARAQKAADSESEDRNAPACLVKDSGY